MHILNYWLTNIRQSDNEISLQTQIKISKSYSTSQESQFHPKSNLGLRLSNNLKLNFLKLNLLRFFEFLEP